MADFQYPAVPVAAFNGNTLTELVGGSDNEAGYMDQNWPKFTGVNSGLLQMESVFTAFVEGSTPTVSNSSSWPIG